MFSYMAFFELKNTSHASAIESWDEIVLHKNIVLNLEKNIS